MNIITVKEAVYTESGQITCQIQVEGISGTCPFTASPDDPEAHGRQFWADLKAEKYGEVKP
ncbi:TPA: hypothetical protein I8Y21_006302, partial [Klebsiella oxytoca]|nr:hypothetical protein [Klebsiella oxytoca]